MNETERRVVDAFDADGLVACLCDLIAIRSVDGHETPAQEFVADRMAAFGLALDTWELDFDALGRHPAFCMEVERTSGLGVCGTLGEAAGGRDLILNGHVDVVDAGDEATWTRPPWRGMVEDGRVYGRGAVDMKGGLCCALFAARALRDAGARLAGRLVVQSVIGEEDGGVGTLAAILRGYRADGAVVAEPTELCVAPAQAGALSFRVTVRGESAHACVREEGVSAIEKFILLHQALLRHERARNADASDPLYRRYRLPTPLCIGRVRGGEWPSSVPEALVFEGRVGVAVGDDPDAARRAFEDALAEACNADDWLRQHPAEVEWWGGQFEPGSIDPAHPLVRTVVEAAADAAGTRPRIEGVTYGADMRLLINEAGTPAVLFGPGDVRRSHRPDESVAVDDLVAGGKTLALAALRFCGQQGGAGRTADGATDSRS